MILLRNILRKWLIDCRWGWLLAYVMLVVVFLFAMGKGKFTTETCGVIKEHGNGASGSNDANSITWDGEPAVTTGFSGVGKSMSSCLTN